MLSAQLYWAGSAATVSVTAPVVGPGLLDVALRELEGLGCQPSGPSRGGQHRLALLLRDRAEGQSCSQPLGLDESRTGIRTDPAAVAGDEAAGHGELTVGVVDRVIDLLLRGDRPRGALAREIEVGVRLTQ